uniref:Ig-like domain-containing protein n=1 Tax=Esox lucius TaxID=8010 RepID=A0A3P8XRY2_ESOLU
MHQSLVILLYLFGNTPKATLSSDQKDILTGDSVTLTCTVESSGWMFYWYGRKQDSEPVATTSGSSYTLSQVSVSDGGQYRCRHVIRLCVSVFTVLPKATLLVKPNPVYPGETVTLTCSVGSYSDWRYKWYKDRNDNVVSQSGSSNPGASFTISITSVSDQGRYWCEGHRVSRPTSSQPSTDITLTVLGQFFYSIGAMHQSLVILLYLFGNIFV